MAGRELFAVPLGISLIGFGAATLVVHGLVSLLTAASKLKRYTAKQMLVAFSAVATNSVSAAMRGVVRTALGLFRWWLFFGVVFTSFSLLYVTYTEYPSVWTGSARFYNGNIGPYLHQLVIAPLQITDVLLRGLLPIWNSVVWFSKAIGIQGFFPIVVDQIEIILKMATTLIGFARHLSTSLNVFVASFFCEGAACLYPEKGVLDVLSCLGDVREFVALGIQILRAFCNLVAAPIDLVLFPLLDLNLAEAMHNLVNSAIQLFIVIPWTTAVRCGLKQGNQYDTLMCTPDFAPFFNFLVSGVSSLGVAVDNWANIAFLIVQEALTRESPKCDPVASGMVPDLIASSTTFANSSYLPVVVGLTDWLYAVTDGVTALYMGSTDGSKTKVQTWPFPGMNVGLGVAAVTYSSVHDLDVSTFSSGKTVGSMQTTSMLACNCTDTANLGMVILCSILPMSGIPAAAALDEYLLQVMFPNTYVAKQYTCQGVDIYVKSVRWSFTRYQTTDASVGTGGGSTTLPTNDCIARGTCREIDATVWMVPKCGQDRNANSAEGCTASAACFPFCMASRSAGSGRDNLMLAGTRRWREGLTILGQDCSTASAAPGTTQAAMGSMGTVSRTEGSGGLLQTGTAGVYAYTYEPQECKRASRITSVIDKPGVSVSANVRLSGQPYAITGDTVFTEVVLGGGASSVQVERLEGSEVDVFSLNQINQQLPALPRALVPTQETDYSDASKVLIPYSYETTRIAAVNSRNYVFYASNPASDAFGAYFQYCRDQNNPDKLGKMGLLLLSSYSPIRIYRVSAYRRCAAYSCGADLVRFETIQGFSQRFERTCDEVFNVSVLALEYLNEDNIAVTVQASGVREFDEQSGTFSGPNTTSKTYWLNPTTMGMRDTIWQTSVPTSSYAVLCPSMQRLPRVGSFGAELVNSAVFAVRFVVFAVAYTPGMVNVWRGGGRCPAPGGTLGHAVLGNCGANLYSLDDFFDSLDDAAAIFWHSLSLTGQLLTPSSNPGAVAPLTQVLDGMSQYGQGTIDLWAARAGVLTLTKVPIKEQLAQLWVTVEVAAQGGALQGLAYGGAGIAAWSRYSYRVLSVLGLDLIKRVLDPKEQLTAKRVFSLIWAGLYDLQGEFSATITSRNRLGCGGLKLIFGLDNPWSDLIYHQCASGAELTEDLIALALNIFVEIPMAKCVCKDSAGQDLSTFVVEVCAPSMPVSLLPTLYMIANEARGAAQFSSLACERVIEKVKADIGGSLDPWFDHQYKALDALGSSVDYVTSVYDSTAGKCLDFQNDPHVVVIVPQPVDYFQRCSGTSACKRVCSAEWGLFQSVVQAPTVPMPSISVSTESMFFPGALDPSLLLNNVEASVEVPSSSGVCLARPSTSPPDYALAVAEVTWPAILVEYWCAPRMASGSVYRNQTSGYGSSGVPGTLLSLQFGDDTGGWLAILVQAADAQEIWLVNRTGAYNTPPVDAILPAGVALMRVENLWVIHGVLVVDLVTRRMTSGKNQDTGHMLANSIAEAYHWFLRPPLDGNMTALNGVWLGTSVDLMQYGGYQYTRLKNGKYLFLPAIGGLPLHRVEFSLSLRYLQQTAMVMLSPTDLSSLSGAVLASNSQGTGHVFATKTTGWDWLKQVRIADDGYVDGVFGSANIEVEVDIQGRCDERGCEGCGTIQLQRLCMAYNKCALVNCVGTPVHQRRPLCGIGGLLRHSGKMSLRSTQGAWSIFSEMLGLTLQLSLLSMHEAHLLWPEDEFLCYICEAKDKSAEFFSILTATVNSALQMGEANIGYMYGGASNVDSNADAVLTISSTALNGFMHQIALYPLYAMVASHQIMMCQITGVLALMDDSGFKLSLKPASGASASDTIAGQCLTVGAEVLANYPNDNSQSLGYVVTSIASNALQLLLIQQIEPFLHYMDAFLAYVIGIVHTLGVLVMSQSMAKCNPPDFYIKDVVKCACGDDRLQIVSARRAMGIPGHNLWCSGVLSMIDSSNKPFYVFNPYTYAELQEMTAGLDAYVQCVADKKASGYKCPVPTVDFFARQGVTAVNVLVKCRENFVKKRWDPAAYVLYQRSFHHLLKLNARIEFPPDNLVQACLREGDGASGSLAQTCLQRFLGSERMLDDEYWAYERVDPGKDGSQYTDACMVFTGPAAQNLTVFQDCVDGLSNSDVCSLPGHIWTPLSANDVPVAERHRVLSHGVSKDGLVQRLYSKARAKVLDAVAESIQFQNKAGVSPVNVEFFSTEGDILHQTMDCIFMGPYSRVDYWPIPTCNPGEECLVGPHWSRDEGAGLTRTVDSKTCPAEPTLPYTCGSPARKSLMRYLVKDLLPSQGGRGNKNNSLIHEILLKTLDGIRSDWANTSTFGCPCDNGLPDGLNKTFTSISSTTVLQALADDLGLLYDQAMEETLVWREYLETVEPGESQRYNWSDKQRVRDEARYDPTKPVATYTSAEEALSPLLQEDSTLWDVCHASLKQVFFTLRMEAGGVKFDTETLAEFDGNASRLEEYVKGFTQEAWKHSPLFRHYSPRHAPSQSQMCEGPASNTTEPEGDGFVSYSDLNQNGQTLLSGQTLPTTTPAYSAQRFRIGEAHCLCGWRRVDGEHCQAPSIRNTHISVCGIVPCVNFAYHIRDEPRLFDAFQPGNNNWYCPEFELSAHWGMMDSPAAEQWLGWNATTLVTSSRDLFQHGRAGLRPGNVRTLPDLARTYLNPKTREFPLESGRLTTCRPPSGTDLAQAFLDELFPAAQGVDESGAVAYCLRYVIELARMEILTLLELGTFEDQLVLQREQVMIWKRRCGAQLHLLHLCVNLGAFRPRLLDSTTSSKCPHFYAVKTPTIYTTAQCLLSVNGQFYDPCRCVPCVGDASAYLNVSAILARGEACRLRFDPRTMLQTGLPIGWFDGKHPLDDETTLSKDEPLLLREGFAGRVLSDPDATGNTQGQTPWWDAEGPMQDNSEFCDTVVDWWGESWTFPIGYHVTVPCDANETAYRSFLQAFALDEAANTLVYQHDLLRDVNLADSHFGVGGLCRSSNYGMPMHETNNVRYCTSIPDGGGEDFTLPEQGGADPTGHGWTPMRCASSSRDLPWPDAGLQADTLYQSARYSVGVLPNMPPESSATYPANEDAMWDLGPWQEVQVAGNRWGLGDRLCQDFDLFLCKNDSMCPDGFACRGRVCSLKRDQSCTRDLDCAGAGTCGGVCLDRSTVECIMHSDCGESLMCSGIGGCVQPELVVQNMLEDENISLGLMAATGNITENSNPCGTSGTPFSLLGGSYWGNTAQDLLRAHGMCSYEDWFKYTHVYSQEGCATLVNGTLNVDPTRCSIVDLQGPTQNNTKWWPAGRSRPELMYLRPTNCDRDYERLKGFSQCAPARGKASLVDADGAREADTYDQYTRLHDSGTSMKLARMPERNDTVFGFLGLSNKVQFITDLTGDAHPYVACSTVGQCFAGDFTVNGIVANRTIDTGGSRKTYPVETAFKCGVYGIDDPAKQGCKLDLDVLPLYKYLCQPEHVIQECTAILPTTINKLCSNIQFEYQPSNMERTSVLEGLTELFYAFPGFNTVTDYLKISSCMSALHAKILERSRANPGKVSRGLYYPFMFVLYEFPFDWFYQCIVMAGGRINAATRRQQDCRAYKERTTHSIDEYTSIAGAGDPFDTYLQYVRGGYTQAQYDAYRGEKLEVVRTAIKDASSSVRQRLYPNGKDSSYPTCSENMLWKVGPYGNELPDYPYEPTLRALIWNWHDSQTCRTNWQTLMIDKLPPSFKYITSTNWIEQLTYPDPVNLAPQGSPAKTMLVHIEDYIISSMGVAPVGKIYTNGEKGALQFNVSMPDKYDETVSPLSTGLIPTRSADVGTVAMDDTVSRTCVFKPQHDPTFDGFSDSQKSSCKNLPGNTSGYTGRMDTLKACNLKPCSSIPVASRRNGRFACGYKAENAIIPPDCNENSQNPYCYKDVLTAMYDAVKASYNLNPPVIGILRASLLPWFNSSNGWDFPRFDLTYPLDYQANIQPNPERAIMCQITTDSARAIDFTKCNNPHYMALKRHAAENYKRDAGIIIPFGNQLTWPLDRGVLERGVILSYTNRNRSLRQTFMDALFDDETVCKASVQERVCWKRGVGDFMPANPWMLGNFNPYEVCDVDFKSQSEGGREYIYSYCQEDNSACKRWWKESPQSIPTKCDANNRKLVTVPGVPKMVSNQYLDYNLCHHRLEEDGEGCMHDQGLLGGSDGLPVAAPEDSPTMLDGTPYDLETYTVAPNLYEPSEWSIPTDFRAGMYKGTNPLWSGDDAPYGHLQIERTDIGGHRIGLALSRLNNGSDSISYLRVVKMPLGEAEGSLFLDNTQPGHSRPVSEWVGTLMADMQAEHDAVKDLYPVTYTAEALGASCPLQRWLFYSGGYSDFSPSIPATQRAKHLFHLIHGGIRSHPTMKRGAQTRQYLGKYRSANGFCACPVLADIAQSQCLIPTSDGDHKCSMSRLIRALQGGLDTESVVFAPLDHSLARKTCDMQLDWPNVDGDLRDGTTLAGEWGKASSPTYRECHVLDRLRPFRYRYESASQLAGANGRNTIKDGVCQTGRVITLQASKIGPDARCLRKSLSDISATFACNTEGPNGKTMPRRARQTLAQVLASRAQRKQRCAQCSPPPQFRSEKGQKIPPESSFGRLHRWSAERMLAKDLRDAVCGPNQTACATRFNASAWRRGEFMRNYMHHPEWLFLLQNVTLPAKKTEKKLEPASRWEGKPWVYCPTPASLKTGEGCKGVMSREEWTRSKTTTCPRTIHSISMANKTSEADDPMARTPFCNIDSSTDKVCRAVADARALVVQANCIMRGDSACMPSPFVYHPASYEPSNNAWVHDSVQAFYKRVDPNKACPVSSTSDLAYLDFMRTYQRACPANAVYLVKSILQTVRVVVTDAALLLTTLLSMFFKMLALFFSVGRARMQAYLVADWLYVKSKASVMLETASDLMIDGMLNSGELGARILNFLHRACNSINSAINWYLGVW